MNRRFILAIVVVVSALSALIYSAVTDTAKSVVTVEELRAESSHRENIRLGARVATGDILQLTEPERTVKFNVRDITSKDETSIPVVYHGVMPDTLKVGRDVILEGNFDGKEFLAKNLVTQCPSKYVPPEPGATSKPGAYSTGQQAVGANG